MQEANTFLTLSGAVLALWFLLEIRTTPSIMSKDKFFKRTKNILSKNIPPAVTIISVLTLFPMYIAQAMTTSHTLYCKQLYCSLHHCPTLLTLCPITYGLVDVHIDDGLARQRLFPLSNSQIYGGCEVGRDGRFKWTMFCPDCHLAESLWQKHRKANLTGIPVRRAPAC
jgi:hypothetical protein